MDIRPLTPDEFPLLEPLAQAFYGEHPLPDSWDQEKAGLTWSRIYLAGMGVILGAWDGDSLCGVLGLALAPSLSDGTLYAQECFWFMDPPRRGAGGKLLKAGEEWAWRYGAEYLMMVGLSTSKATVGTFLRRRGYQAMETRYVLRRPPVEEVEGEEMPS